MSLNSSLLSGLFSDEFSQESSNTESKVDNHDFDLNNPFEAIVKEEVAKLDLILKDTTSEIGQAEALRRLSYIQYIEKNNSKGWTEKNLKPLLSGAESLLDGPLPSWRTIVSWRKIYNDSGCDLNSLIPRHNLKGNRNGKSISGDGFYWQAVNKKYLSRERPTISSTYKYYKDLIILANRNVVEGKVEAISKRAFYSRIQKLHPYDVMAARYGKQRADREFRVVGAHIRPTRILERVEIDHTPLDLILLDDTLLIPLGRPYLTALIDSFSGCVVGFYIGYKEPGYDSVRKALLNAMLSKDYIKDLYPSIKKEWPCEGKIETLVVDNGAEFWSTSLEYACKSIVSDIQYNPVAKPWLKPMVERFFGSLSQKLIVSMPGKTFSGIDKLDGYDPQKDAVMRFSVFMEVFHKWIIDVYNFEPNSRETNIPILSWQIGVREFPPVVYMNEDTERLVLDLGLAVDRNVRRDGITYKGLRYDSKELVEFRKQNTPGKDKKLKVLIKINPSDLEYIYVLGREGSYIKVPCVEDDEYVKGLTLFQHETYRRFSRNFIRSEVDSESLAEARMEIESRIGQEVENISKLGRRIPKSLKGAKAVARHRDIGSDTVSNKSIANQVRRSTRPPAPPKSPESTDSHSKLLEQWDDLADDLDAY